jgi:hypothetical protein
MDIQEKTKDAISTAPTVIGTPFGGGFYAGRILIAGVLHGLIVAPKAEGERADLAWLDSEASVVGACSYNDGLENTVAMAEAGSDLAQWARGLQIDGYADWYIPSQDELEVLYRNLKPTARLNSLYGRSGVNPSAMPSTHQYTTALPAKTAADGFAEGGEQAFADEWYWSSTQHAAHADCAWGQDFDDGYQSTGGKSAQLRARAVRRFPI